MFDAVMCEGRRCLRVSVTSYSFFFFFLRLMSTRADAAQTWADSHLLEPYWSVLGEMSEMVDLG